MYYAILPIRSKSKGVPNKNIKPFYKDLSLTQITLESIMNHEIFDKIVISTDSDTYLEHVNKYDIVALKRSEDLSSDTAKTSDVILDIIDRLNIKDDDTIVLLQVTSPFRKTIHIEEAISLFESHNKKFPVISFVEKNENPILTFNFDKDKVESPFFDNLDKPLRQSYSKLYRPNGAIYILTTALFKKYGNFYHHSLKPYFMDEISSIDIDTENDWLIATLLMQHLNTI